MELDESELRKGIVLLRDSATGCWHVAPTTAIRGLHELDDGRVAVSLWSQAVVVDAGLEDLVAQLGWRR